MINKLLHISLLLASLFFTLPLQALTGDSDQPMNIEADRVDIDDEKGISTFLGNVIITRGTIRITGDKIIVYRDKDKNLDKVHSVGKPAHYQQRPDNKADDVIAEGKEIFYDAAKEILILRKQARIIQGGDIFTGDHITYDSRRDKVIARRSKATGGKGRVHITIQPKKKNK